MSNPGYFERFSGFTPILRIALLCFTFLLPSLQAGVVITSETREIRAGGASETVVFHFAEGRLRLDSGEGADGDPAMSVIFDEKTKAMLNIDHRAKAYKEFTEDNIEQFAKRVSDLQQRVDAKLEALEPDQREAAQELLQRRLAAAPDVAAAGSVVKTNVRRKIGDYTCVKYEVRSGDETKRELWVASWGELGVLRGTFNIFSSMATFYKKVVNALSFWSKTTPEPDPMGDFESLDGFPVLIKHFRNGEVVRETTFKKFETRELTAELFQPPAEYRKQVPFPAEGG